MLHLEILLKKSLIENQKKNHHKSKNYYLYKHHKKKYRGKNNQVNKRIQKKINLYQKIR